MRTMVRNHRLFLYQRLISACVVLLIVGLAVLNESAMAASANVSATGRIVYQDEGGTLIPVRKAKITLYDDDFPVPEVMAVGWTEDDGTFTISGEADDIDICAGTIVGDECCQGVYASNCTLGTPYGDGLCCDGVYEPDACNVGDLYVGNDECCPLGSYDPFTGNCFAASDDRYPSYRRCTGVSFPEEMMCGGIWTPLDYPDPYIKVEAVSAAGKITILGGSFNYCMQSSVRQNVSDGATIDFGDIMPANAQSCCDLCFVDVGTENIAWHWHNELLTVYEFMRPIIQNNPGGSIPPSTIVWPSELSELGGSSFREPLTGIIHLNRNTISQSGVHGTTWREEVLYHEYGHHILQTFADSPAPNYFNDVCDDFPAAGHCAWRPEDGCFLGDPGTCENTSHFTEGFPNFLSKVVAETTARTSLRDWETPLTADDICIFAEPKNCPTPGDDLYFVEGISAAIMWDLYDGNAANPADPANDNHDGNHSTDRLNLSFATIWDVIMNYDPDPLDNWPLPQTDAAIYWVDHPVTIDQFYDGLISSHPDMINRISEIYHENHLDQGVGADMTVLEWSTSLQGDEPRIQPGESFEITDTTANIGDRSPEVQGVAWVFESELPAVTRSYIIDYPADTFEGVLNSVSNGNGMVVGERTVNSLPGLYPTVSSAADTASTTATIPVNAIEKIYYLITCSDAAQAVFETNEANNCTQAIRVVVRYADNDGDGHRADVDCDDTNPDVFPGAPEICNDRDDDCDGLADERLPRMDYYPDGDGDGYGDITATALRACAEPENYVGNNLDCNDTLTEVHPNASEICNNRDDNCDGWVDEGFDLDNDGFKTCDGDCDDAAPAIHPAMAESCNALDDNCDGIVDEGFHSDDDGLADCFDNCPGIGNPLQEDLDNDGAGDPCDPDDDNDGSADDIDNCPRLANADQANNDGDDFGDICDSDDDNDGLADASDACPFEDATGFDADNNGCVDSISGLSEVFATLVSEGVVTQQLQNSLTSKLDNAAKSATKENICAAINQLSAFSKEVAAQRNKKISESAADLLSAYVSNLISRLSAQLPEGVICS